MSTALAQSATAVARVRASGVVKRFPGVVALSGVDFELHAGEVHCLVGENGAGKSTLIKILSGFYAPDEGEVLVDGTPLGASTTDARDAGIATIHQEHNLIPALSVAENVVLGNWSEGRRVVSRRRVRERARAALAEVAPRIPLDTPAQALSAADGQLVEIARAVAQDARVVIMDEPTTALTEADVERLFELVDRLRARGLAILYVSHKLEEVFALGDRMTVLRDGATVTSGLVDEFDSRRVVRLMVGDDVELYHHVDREAGDVVLECRGLGREGVFAGVDLQLRAGEILGLGGLVGAGRSEVARCLFGADQPDTGEILVDGRPVKLRSPADGVLAGIGLVPEERKQQAVVQNLSVRENIALSLLDRLAPHGVMRRKTERELVERYFRELGIRAPSVETRIGTLSGGNQQKAILARWLAREPRILILDEPTKGIDIGAKAEIHRLIEQLARAGIAVLLISSELPELLALSDRVAVMRAGSVVSVLDRSQATKEAVTAHAAG